MTARAQQFGLKAESTVGTGVTVDRFHPIIDESLRPNRGRVRTAGRRAGAYAHRTDGYQTFTKSVSGGVKVHVPTKGFGYILAQIMGGTPSFSGATDSNYTGTYAGGTHRGKSATLQVNRPTTADSDIAFTHVGCKLRQAVFEIDVDGLLTCSTDWLGQTYNRSDDSGDALASVSYTAHRYFAWSGAAMTIGGSSVDVRGWKTTITIPYDEDEAFYMRGSSLMREPLENDLPTVVTEFTIRHASMTQYNRFAAAAAASSLGALVTTFTSDVLTGVSTYPSIAFTVANADFEEVDGPNVAGNQVPTQTFRTLGLADSGWPLSVAVVSTDNAI